MALSLPSGGFLDRHIAPLLKTGTDSLRPIANVLGSTLKNFTFTPDQVRAQETFTLQRLMEGRSDYLGFTISSAMESANPVIFDLFPMKKANAITFQTEYYDFPKQLAIATPAQAPPAYVKALKRSWDVTLERYALGATTTVQEIRTTEGQFVFRGKLITVAVGFIEVAELLAIQLLLTRPTMYASYWIEAGQHPIDLARAGRMTDLYFDILRRRENGMAELVDLVRKSMKHNRIMPTHIILAEGMRALYMASPKYLEYFRIGAEAADNSRRLTEAAGDSFDGLRFMVISPYDMGEADLTIDPLVRTTMIGQHFRMDNFFGDELCGQDYCSKFYSIQFFTMEDNNWVTIKIDDALENCERFSPADGGLLDHHYSLVEDLANMSRKSGVPVYRDQYDMFIYMSISENEKRPVANVCELWGHMEKWALDDSTIRRIALTTVSAMKRAFGTMADKYLEAIALGLADIQELYSQSFSERDLAFLAAEAPVSRTGVRELPRNPAGLGENANLRPPGYGSVRGYWEIGEKYNKPGYAYLDQELAKRADAFRKASIQMHAFYTEVYGVTHPALDPQNAPSDYLAANGQLTDAAAQQRASILNFFQNIVDKPKATLLLAGAGVEAGGEAVEALPEDSAFANLNDVFAAQPVPPSLAARFGSEVALERFERSFAESTFARVYADYVSGQRAGGRRRRGQPSVDVDAAQPFGDAEGSALAQFHKREVTDADLTSAETIALYTRVIDYVDHNTAPEFIDVATLKAWHTDNGGNALRGRLAADNVPANTRRTAFVASLDALRNSAGAFAERDENGQVIPARIFLSSPNNAEAPISLGAAQAAIDGTGANDDLLRTSIVASKARPAVAPEQGIRARASRGGDTADSFSIFGGISGQPPGYALDAFTDVVGSTTVVNKNLTGRFADASKMTNWAERIAAQMFLLAPINKKVLKQFDKLNIAMPVAWLLEMPFRRYKAASMIFVSKSSVRDFGATRYLDFDTHIGRNAINKNLMVHVSGYMGATADDWQDWFVAHDVAVVGYNGGENARAIRLHNWNMATISEQGFEAPSIFYFMVLANSLIGNDKTPVTHDIRGYADAVNYKGNSVHSDSQWGGRPFFSTALYYNSMFGLNEASTPLTQDWSRFHPRRGMINTVTQQGHQRIRDTHTGNFGTKNLISSEPFKNSVYPGAAELRDSALPRTYDATDYAKSSEAF